MDPVFRRVLASRGVTSVEESVYKLSNMLAINEIKHLSEAAAVLVRHIDQGGKLLIFGDYDADGATSTALCMRALSLMGHNNLSYLMPGVLRDVNTKEIMRLHTSGYRSIPITLYWQKWEH